MSVLDEILTRPDGELSALLENAKEEELAAGFVSDQTRALIEAHVKRRSRDETLTQLANWYQYTNAKLRGAKAEYEPLIKEMEAEIKFLKDRAVYIERLIKCALPPSLEAEHINEQHALFYNESEETEITNAEEIPIELCEVKAVPSKTLIKAAIEAGQSVNGAQIKKNFNLQVKPGGMRALANAKSRRKRRFEKDESPGPSGRLSNSDATA
jgi:hypothetical protein